MKVMLCTVTPILLLMAVTMACSQTENRNKEIYFNVEGRNVGSTNIERATVQFDDFKFQWGSMDTYATKDYFADISRVQPKVATLSWDNGATGRNVLIGVPIPELPNRFHGERPGPVHGKYRSAGLILRFDIDPDTGSACAVWTDVEVPPDDVKCR